MQGFLVSRIRRQEMPSSDQPSLSQLTPMEVRVLKLVVENRTNEEIARQLFISPHTVHDYVKAVHQHLGVSRRQDLIERWVAVRVRDAERHGIRANTSPTR